MWKRAIPVLLLALVGVSWLIAASVPGGPGGGVGRAAKGGALEQKLGRTLADLGRIGEVNPVAPDSATTPRQRSSGRPLADLSIVRGLVLIDAAAQGDSSRLLSQLELLGLENGAAYGHMVSGRLPVDSLAAAVALPELRFARPAHPYTRAGSVTSQGDAAVRGDVARSLHGLDGTGITVGILSDSFDCAGTETSVDIASGDLPTSMTILNDTGCPGSDEGRAMAQVIHDVASGAAIIFRAAGNGQADFATGIAELAGEFGVDVIVDDTYYSREPMFQDGVVAQAVGEAVAHGVPVISAVGNNGRLSYEDSYRSSGIGVLFGGDAHDFDVGIDVDVYQSLTVPVDRELILVLQWDSPFFSVSGAPGSLNDLDICLMNEPPTTTIACGDDLNIGGDPVELISFYNDGTWGTAFNLVIELYDGPPPGRIKTILLADGTLDEYDTAGSTVFGHANAAATLGVGAAFYAETPVFGTDPAMVQPSSSLGGTPVLFDLAGAMLPSPDVRQQPRLVAPDGVNNTFFGADIQDPGGGSDRDKLPNFFGTSAGAAHVAGVTALLRQRNPGLTPAYLGNAMESTAADMDDPATAGFDTGFDLATGFGLIDAEAAAGAIPECGNGVVETPEECDDGNTVDGDACGNDCLDNICGDGIVHPARGEECDDGNFIDSDFCRNDCLWNFCGDVRLTPISAELLINGDFELGTLAGWQPENLGNGTFLASAPGADTPLGRRVTAGNPAGGIHYAVSDGINSGTHALEQAFQIPATASDVTLSFEMFVNDHSGAGPLIDPSGLDHTGGPNQHARVDLLAAGTAAFDTGTGVLAGLYLGVDPGPLPNTYVSYRFDLLALVTAGITYELRFAEVDNQFFQNQGVDNVSVVASLMEECDDGNNIDGDGCSANCLLECATPAEIKGLSVQAGGIIQWTATAAGAYDVLRSESLPVGTSAETCVATATSMTTASDVAEPAMGQVFHYMVRGHSACGTGTYGHGSDGTERTSAACP